MIEVHLETSPLKCYYVSWAREFFVLPLGQSLVRLSSTAFCHRAQQVPLPSISPELRMQLLWPSWCMVTNCKQQLECELDLSELPFNALLHSYCSGIILVFCRGEEELCHFLVSIFTVIQMHSYSVQLLWHVCHAILTSSRRTVPLEGRICLHCALDSEEMQHRTLGSAGLREHMSQIFLSRQNSRQGWGSAMCRALVRAALRLCFLLPPFSSLSSTCDSSPQRRGRSACRTRMPTLSALSEQQNLWALKAVL